MSEENKKLNDEELKQIAGGNDGMGDGTFSVVDIPDTWVRVTASELNCRYWPNGNIAKTYEYGHRLKVVLRQTACGTDCGSIIPREESATAISTKPTQSPSN